jgi:chromosome segregation ATPase
MENLERLAGSIAQVELLVASLKRECRDLATRLASAASERRQALDQAEEARRLGREEWEAERAELQARLEQGLARETERHEAEVLSLTRALQAAQNEVRADPNLEARVHQAELESAELARRLDAEARAHYEEKARFEALIRQLEAQVMADRGLEQMPVASAEALAEAKEAQREAQAGQEAAQERAKALEDQLRRLQERLDAVTDSEARASQDADALRTRLAEQERRVTALESAGLDLERELSDTRLRLAGAPKPEEVEAWKARLLELEGLAQRSSEVQARGAKLDAEQAELRRQKRELAAFAKERQTLRRKVEELVSTLESVRLG